MTAPFIIKSKSHWPGLAEANDLPCVTHFKGLTRARHLPNGFSPEKPNRLLRGTNKFKDWQMQRPYKT
jgi:hypothetical protein